MIIGFYVIILPQLAKAKLYCVHILFFFPPPNKSVLPLRTQVMTENVFVGQESTPIMMKQQPQQNLPSAFSYQY